MGETITTLLWQRLEAWMAKRQFTATHMLMEWLGGLLIGLSLHGIFYG